VRLGGSDGARAELGRWLAIAGAGVIFAVAAWAVYLPTSDHYSPTAVGTVNRVNAAAAIGVAILVYSIVVLLARMLARFARVPAWAAAAGVSSAVLALGFGYVERSALDAGAWDAAA